MKMMLRFSKDGWWGAYHARWHHPSKFFVGAFITIKGKGYTFDEVEWFPEFDTEDADEDGYYWPSVWITVREELHGDQVS